MGQMVLGSQIQGRRDKVLIVDEHPVICHGLSFIFGREPDLAVCGATGEWGEGRRLLQIEKPDALVIDLMFSGSNALEGLREIRTLFPDMPILVFSMLDEVVFGPRALRAGASGYVMKLESAERIVEALRCVLRGRIYLSPSASERVLRSIAAPGVQKVPVGVFAMELLTDRELQIFELFGRGFGTKEIADSLKLSAKTIETHRLRLKEKLGLARASELMQAAARWVQDRQSGPLRAVSKQASDASSVIPNR